jgi:hypothetical protein
VNEGNEQKTEKKRTRQQRRRRTKANQKGEERHNSNNGESDGRRRRRRSIQIDFFLFFFFPFFPSHTTSCCPVVVFLGWVCGRSRLSFPPTHRKSKAAFFLLSSSRYLNHAEKKREKGTHRVTWKEHSTQEMNAQLKVVVCSGS